MSDGDSEEEDEAVCGVCSDEAAHGDKYWLCREGDNGSAFGYKCDGWVHKSCALDNAKLRAAGEDGFFCDDCQKMWNRNGGTLVTLRIHLHDLKRKSVKLCVGETYGDIDHLYIDLRTWTTT